MNILYIHGFGSKYDPEHEKIKALETLGVMCGVDLDYTRGFRNCFEIVLEEVLAQHIDLIVGTSMGGYMAAHVGAETGVPFVALNPAISPSNSLQQWIGHNTAHDGTEFILTDSIVANYPDIIEEGCGLVIVETGDEVISASNTISKLAKVFKVAIFPGGSHRFTHIENALPLITEHYTTSTSMYGIETS